MTQSYTGQSRYLTDYPAGMHRLLVAIRCHLEPLPLPSWGLLDTASEWCILPAELSTEAGFPLAPDPLTLPLHSRFGVLEGRLERIPVTFPAETGSSISIDATCFISEHWTGPLVIGWKGCLERMRFALDPNEETFYFSEL